MQSPDKGCDAGGLLPRPKGRFFDEYALGRGARRRRLCGKCCLQPKRGRDHGLRRLKLSDNEDEIVAITFDQIPSVTLQLVMDVLSKSRRTIEMHGLPASHEQAKQMIESNEMIDMRVGDENAVDALYFPR
jgi:hypothetical protein